jgi:hypothetical protein
MSIVNMEGFLSIGGGTMQRALGWKMPDFAETLVHPCPKVSETSGTISSVLKCLKSALFQW